MASGSPSYRMRGSDSWNDFARAAKRLQLRERRWLGRSKGTALSVGAHMRRINPRGQQVTGKAFPKALIILTVSSVAACHTARSTIRRNPTTALSAGFSAISSTQVPRTNMSSCWGIRWMTASSRTRSDSTLKTCWKTVMGTYSQAVNNDRLGIPIVDRRVVGHLWTKWIWSDLPFRRRLILFNKFLNPKSKDPMIGTQNPAESIFVISQANGAPPVKITGFSTLITTKGTAYCFLPSITAVKFISQPWWVEGGLTPCCFLTKWFGVTGSDAEWDLAREKSEIQQIIELSLLMPANAAAKQHRPLSRGTHVKGVCAVSAPSWLSAWMRCGEVDLNWRFSEPWLPSWGSCAKEMAATKTSRSRADTGFLDWSSIRPLLLLKKSGRNEPASRRHHHLSRAESWYERARTETLPHWAATWAPVRT